MQQMKENPLATFWLSNGASFDVELFPLEAPQSVAHFVELIEARFYEGLPFWRIERGSLIQTGCNKGDGTGTAGYCIEGEFRENGFNNGVEFTPGTLGYARLVPDGASSAVFILVSAKPELDGKFAGFARVVRGMDIIENISKGASRPASEEFASVHIACEPVFIQKAEVDLRGSKLQPVTRLPEPTSEEVERALERYKARNRAEG
jgi:peptidyl-prolyl cis-trans isomerase B (cyclophilin B)